MNFFRRLTADIPGELLAAQIATTSSRTAATTEPDAWIPAPEHPEIWAALAAVGNSNGVIDHTTSGLPMPAGHHPDEEIS